MLSRDDVQHIQRVAVERGASPRRRTSAAQDMDDARTTRARVRRARFFSRSRVWIAYASAYGDLEALGLFLDLSTLTKGWVKILRGEYGL